MTKDREKGRPEIKKVRIGRLHIDPVFLVIFLFFTISSFLLVFFMWLAS
ncbi:MAG: hypothetical protein MJA84_10155 [Firmicutes bacterium]|nr:hypothetical protein [Bacillota bacterium]